MTAACKAPEVKYILIVSQYYHSRHFFVISTDFEDADYYRAARDLIVDLEAHKRDRSVVRPPQYGDMDQEYFRGKTRRYNINDSGDIYFIPCYSMEQVLNISKEFWEHSKRDSRGYIKNVIQKQIGDHHFYSDIRKLVAEHFTIL